MLRLALSYADKQYEIQPQQGGEKTLLRVINEVQGGQMHVMWTATDKEKEEQLLPIRIPLFKGMFGFRVFIINRDTQSKFDGIESFDQLKNAITFGQGRTWADTEILKAGGLTVVTTMKFSGLMHMVDGGRFDAFPRGVHEPWSELEAFSQLNLSVEKNLVLHYKMPFYFFVSNTNRELGRDIEMGLNRAIADGSFDRMFYANEAVQSALEKANLKNRRVFEIPNPNLSSATPIERKELWLDVESL
ncbi:diguanylate cyclase [Cellvibrio sp. KY-GH-1]|nr:diguanylate cyclase [Cellvibrio sp. KY-GH-1]